MARMPHGSGSCDHSRASGGDAFCRDCGAPLASPPVPSDRRASRRSGCSLVPRPGRGLFVLGLVLVAYCSQQLAASHNHGQGDDHNHESNTGLWHRVGELFNREQIRQRKIKHGKADAVENGPKEISIFCPNDPTIKIVDLSEDERNRDECLVLNIAAPDVSSRLVLFCNAHSLDDDEEEDEDDDDDGFSEEDVQSSEL